MNILGLRSSLPPAGNSVLAHRLRIEVAPPRWLPFVVRALRVVVSFWVSFQFSVGLFEPFQRPFGLGTMLSIVIGFTLWWALNLGCARFDPRVQAWLLRWVNHAPPLMSLFRDWNTLTARLAASPYAVQQRGGIVRERDHIFLGTVHGSCWPFLFDISKPRHTLLTGATSSGKPNPYPLTQTKTQPPQTPYPLFSPTLPSLPLSRFFPDGHGGLERSAEFEPADLPRLVCVVQTLCGHFAKLDELDEFTAKRLQCLHNILAEFMDYSLERMEADDGEFFSRLESHSTPQ